MAEAYFAINCTCCKISDPDGGVFFIIDDRDIFGITSESHLPEGYRAEVETILASDPEPYQALIRKFKKDKVFHWSTEGY